MLRTDAIPGNHPAARRPSGRRAVRFEWRDLLFLHWPVPAPALREYMPDGLTIDQWDGAAWIGLVPFTMRDVQFSRLPPIPSMRHFCECNVRTYVTYEGEPGVWFISLDAHSRLAVWGARRFWHLNYVSADVASRVEQDVVRYRVQRRADPSATLRCHWRVGSRLALSKAGSQAHFLTERYMLYSADRRGRIYRGRIWHEPWTLHDAELIEFDDGLLAAQGIDVGDAPPVSVMAAAPIVADAWPLECVG